jgi:hypothetical protein
MTKSGSLWCGGGEQLASDPELESAVDAGDRPRQECGGQGPRHGSPAAVANCRSTVRFINSTLNPFSDKGLAP